MKKYLGKAGIPVGKQILPRKKKKSFDIKGVDNREIKSNFSAFGRIIKKLAEICLAKILFKNVVYRYNKTAKGYKMKLIGGEPMKRQILLGESDLTELAGRPITCQYHLLIRTLLPPLNYESYGVGIVISQTGEREEIWDITTRSERIEELANRLICGGVTPCALREVVEDWL